MAEIVDAHFHLLAEDSQFHAKYDGGSYADAAGVDRAAVCVETGLVAGDRAAEVAWLDQQLSDHQLRHAIVGGVDLGSPESCVRDLEKQIEAASGRLRGVRITPESVPAGSSLPDMYSSETLASLARALNSHGLILEVWSPYAGLANLDALARSAPELPIVVEHMGGPVRGSRATPRQESLEAWWVRMLPLVDVGNIRVKISGLAMPFLTPRKELADSSDWRTLVEYWSAPTQRLFEAFGTDRCMVGSNFPMDDHLVTYDEMVAVLTSLAGMSGDPTAVLAGTAQQVYRLPSTH